MNRSNYDDCCDGWELIRWRGAVAAAIKGRRGQAFLKEMATALDAMPEKRLIRDALQSEEGVCAMGCVARARGMDMSKIDPECPEQVAREFGIACAMAQEIAFINDDEWGRCVTPEKRWEIVRKWVRDNIQKENDQSPPTLP